MPSKCFRVRCQEYTLESVALVTDCDGGVVCWKFQVCKKCQNAAQFVKMVAIDDIILTGEKAFKSDSDWSLFRMIPSGFYDYCEKCGPRLSTPFKFHQCEDADGESFFGEQAPYQYE